MEIELTACGDITSSAGMQQAQEPDSSSLSILSPLVSLLRTIIKNKRCPANRSTILLVQIFEDQSSRFMYYIDTHTLHSPP